MPSKRRVPVSPSLFPTTIPLEGELYRQGFRLIAGIDEAGRGPLAGPVVAAAVVLPAALKSHLLKDSKILTPEKRETAFDFITLNALAVGVGMVDNEEIDRINILEATRKAMCLSVKNLSHAPDFLLLDGIHTISHPLPQWAVKGGEAQSPSIAAASIIAKVTRDRMMEEYHRVYPHYNFLKNKGYGTAEHLQAIREFGICPLHRKTFRRVGR